jgi:hypothetical protein
MEMPMFRPTELEAGSVSRRAELNGEGAKRRSWWRRMHMPIFRPALPELDAERGRTELNASARRSQSQVTQSKRGTVVELEGSAISDPRAKVTTKPRGRDLPSLPTNQTPCPGTEVVANERKSTARQSWR